MRIPTLLIAVALSIGLTRPATAEGDPRPALSEFLTVERYTQALLQVGVLALRDQVDFTYTDISSDYLSSTVSMHGLKIYPPVQWPTETPCVISAERATIAGANPAQWDTLRLRLVLYDATASASCVMPSLDQQFSAAGMSQIELNRFEIELAYTVGPARLQVATHFSLAELAAVNLNLDFAYFAIKRQDDFVSLLSSASVSIEDIGLWKKAKPMLPPAMSDPNAVAQLIQQGLTEAFHTATAVPNGAQQALPAEQLEFIAAAAREASRFVAKPGTIVIEMQPEQPVFINTAVAEDFPYLFSQLKPRVSSKAGGSTQLITAAKLRAALGSPQMLGEDERRSIGMALIAGVGAPKSAAAGRALLEPLAEAGDGAAALAVARELKASDPAAAYRLALQAGSSRAEGAARLLDDLEQNLTTAQVLALQADGLPPLTDDTYATISAIRNQAIAHLSGVGSRRSYRQAMYWASLAAATGDASAARIIADVEDRMRYRGDAAAAAWRAEADAAGTDALDAWMDRGLATKLRAHP